MRDKMNGLDGAGGGGRQSGHVRDRFKVLSTTYGHLRTSETQRQTGLKRTTYLLIEHRDTNRETD